MRRSSLWTRAPRAVLEMSNARSASQGLVMYSEDLWDIGDLVGAGDDGIRCTDLQVAGLAGAREEL